jgi:hypothetical protein
MDNSRDAKLMIIPVRVDDKVDTVIIGWAPGKNGEPMAVVPWPIPEGGYGARAVKLSDIRFLRLPEKLQRKLRRQAKKLRQETQTDS